MENEDSRFGLIERSLTALTAEVSRLANMMERLITVEERNKQIDQKVDFVRETLNKDIHGLTEALKDQTSNLTSLNSFMWKVTGIGATILVVVTPLVSILLSKVL